MPFPLVTVPAVEINLENRLFKVSRNTVGDRFRDSVRSLGILDPPLFLREGRGCVILFGFNRVLAALDAGCREVVARVIDRFDPELFARECALKSLREELGPMGKIRALSILYENGAGAAAHDELFRRWLGVPSEFTDNRGLLALVDAFPPDLKDFLDGRDAGFKTIRELAYLGPASLARVARWTGETAMSLNHIKQLAEMAHDIERRDGSLGGIDDSAIAAMDDRRERAETLFREVFRCRYPEYSALRGKVDGFVRDFRKKGMELDFPRYFEGSSFRITITVGRDESPGDPGERFGSVPHEWIRELQKML